MSIIYFSFLINEILCFSIVEQCKLGWVKNFYYQKLLIYLQKIKILLFT